MPTKVSANEYMPLSRVRDFIEVSGVYEILCLKTERVYIGQSVAVAYRASQHLQDLKNNRHSNKSLQYDWNEIADPATFVFKVVTPLDPLDRESLITEEAKEINRRRENKVVLYNDTSITKVVEDNRIGPVKTVPAPAYNTANNNDPYVRKEYTYEIEANQATCSDCGLIGIVGQYLFKCEDRELRCERCVDKRSRVLEGWLALERSRIAKEIVEVKRITSSFKMRWQLGFGSLKNNMLRAVSAYVSKYGQFPAEAIFPVGAELPEMDDIKFKFSKYTPDGYVDFPIPEKADNF